MTGTDAVVPATPPRRPPSVVGGSVLMVARTVSGGAVIATVLTRWEEFSAAIESTGARPDPIDPQAAAAVLGWSLGGYGLVLLLYLGLTGLVFAGRNGARVLAMTFASVSILVSFADYSLNGAQITLRTSLVSVTLDILILLALSSTNARHYAGAVRAARRDRAAR